MFRQRGVVGALALLLILLAPESRPGPAPTLEDIIDGNIEAAGGTEKLASIKNYTLRLGSQLVHSLRDGRMRSTTGRPPAITGVTVVDGDLVKSNVLNETTEHRGLTRAIHLTMAKLYGGVFTLAGFRDALRPEGLKRFGPKTYHMASTQLDDIGIAFYLDPEDFTIKRLVFQGYDPVAGKQEVNYDFGPYHTVDGIRIPESWFSSRVGIRGNQIQVADVRWNPPLNEAQFSSLEINTGIVEAGDGMLSGNVMDVGAYEKMMNVTTNWRDESVKASGFKPKDRLTLKMGDETIEAVFYDSVPPGEAFSPGAVLLFRSWQADVYLIFFVPPAGQSLKEKLEPLSPIEAKRTI